MIKPKVASNPEQPSSNEFLSNHTKNQTPSEREPLINGHRQLKQYQSFNSTNSLDDDNSPPLTFNKNRDGKEAPRIVRQISAILASTGERTRRWSPEVNTDNIQHGSISEDDLEAQPLLSNHMNRQSVFCRASNALHYRIANFKDWIFKNKYGLVLKCSLAYLLASMAVYNSTFSKFIGHSDSKHVVATVAVYFHPSRTFGSMHQSLIFVVIAIVFSFSVSLISTGIASQLHVNGHRTWSILTNLLFASFAQSIISYMKQLMNHQTFNVACSLASMSMISAIIKEGSQTTDKIPIFRLYSLFKIVCCGCLITVAICYLVLPSSAEKDLKSLLNDCCSLMSQYLTQIENSFINGSNVNTDDLLSGLNSKLKKKLTTLNTCLDEAKYELCLVGKEEQYQVLTKLVKSTQFLGYQLGGLKLSADMQWAILHAQSDQTSPSSVRSIMTLDSSEIRLSSGQEENDPSQIPLSESTVSLNDMSALDANELFDLFIHYLGPSLKSFCYTIQGVLDGMPFEDKDDYPTKDTFHYRNSLRLAGELFDKKYARAITKLYSQRIFKQAHSLESKIDEEEIAAACGNFAANLSEYSKELGRFIQALEEYSTLLENDDRSWEWIKFWKLNRDSAKDVNSPPGLDFALQKLNTTLQERSDETEQTTKTFNYKLWEFFSFFRKVETQFAIRVGLGFFFLATLAYLPATKKTFNEWRGEWALVTYSIIMNKSLGGTTMTINWRFLGTFLGAFGAYLLWTLSDGNVYVMALSGWIISLFSFSIILFWPANNAYGRFILLTYNITALYSFNVTRSSDVEGDTDLVIADIAIHRFLGIMGGVLWALIMTVSFLPMTARHRLKKGLSILWLRLGIIWNSDPLNYKDYVLTGLADQRGINHIMRELELLLKQAPKETRLKGKFRIDIYQKLLKSTEKIIDAFQNMNTIISVEPRLSENELIVLNITKPERIELQNRIFLIFYMISSSITLGIPLPSKPASTERSKDRIMVQLGEIRDDKLLADEDYVLLYSYVLVSNVLTNELDKIIKLLGDLYGLVNEETLEI